MHSDNGNESFLIKSGLSNGLLKGAAKNYGDSGAMKKLQAVRGYEKLWIAWSCEKLNLGIN